MFIFTGKVGETISVADGIEITVKETDGCHVMLEIEAPKDVSVHREEIYQRIKTEENLVSAKKLEP